MAQSKLSTGFEAAEPVASPVEGLIAGLKFEQRAFDYRTITSLNGEAKYLEWDFTDSGFDQLQLIQITDMQMGHRACKVDRVIEYRDWVLAEPNRYMIWTGDNVDAAHMLSKGTTWDNLGDPQSQVFEFAEIWAPAAHRIVGYVGGNHERRPLTTFGDLGRLIAAILRVPYSSGKQLIDIKFGERDGHRNDVFRISQWHGFGGARTIGAVTTNLTRFASDGDSHVYLMGHHHKPVLVPFWKERRGASGIKNVKTVAAAGSSFLDTWGSYAEVAGFAPSDVIMPMVELDANGKWRVVVQ